MDLEWNSDKDLWTDKEPNIASSINWNEYFFSLLPAIASKSRDPSTKVGAIIVTTNNEIVSSGFNGFPRGVLDLEERYNVRSTKIEMISHAERNAIYAAARRGIPLDGCRIFVEFWPCNECMKAIIQSGIQQVNLNGNSKLFKDEALFQRWKDSFSYSQIMAKEANIEINIWQ